MNKNINRIELMLSNGKWIIVQGLTYYKIQECLKSFPMTHTRIILFYEEDIFGEEKNITIVKAKWIDDDDYFSEMTYDEMEELLDKAKNKNTRNYIINKIGIPEHNDLSIRGKIKNQTWKELSSTSKREMADHYMHAMMENDNRKVEIMNDLFGEDNLKSV